jgi:hypothetical protein
MTDFLKSPKRTYQIDLPEKLTARVVSEFAGMTNTALQEYIETNFKKANRLGSSDKSGAWAESRMFRDKAKIAIIEMDCRKAKTK